MRSQTFLSNIFYLSNFLFLVAAVCLLQHIDSQVEIRFANQESIIIQQKQVIDVRCDTCNQSIDTIGTSRLYKPTMDRQADTSLNDVRINNSAKTIDY